MKNCNEGRHKERADFPIWDGSQTRNLDEDEKLLHQISVSGQNREVTFINESGLYSLILSSKKPQAKAFKLTGMKIR